MQKRWSVFPFLITKLMTICKSCLEKSLKDSNKICQLFARISYNSYFGKYLKIWYQWLQGSHLPRGPTSANVDAVSQKKYIYIIYIYIYILYIYNILYIYILYYIYNIYIILYIYVYIYMYIKITRFKNKV